MLNDSPPPTQPGTASLGRPGTLVQLLGGVLAVAIVVVGGASVVRQHEQAQRDALQRMQTEADHVAARFDQFFRSRYEVLDAIARTPMVQHGTPAEAKAYFERIATEGSAFSGGLSLVGTDGIQVLLSGFPLNEPPIDLSDRDYVQAVLRTGQPFYGNAIIGRRSGDPLLTVAVPVPGIDGRVNGVLAGTIRIDLAEGGLARIGQDLRDAVILDGTGQVIVDRGTVRRPAPVAEPFRTLVAVPGAHAAAPATDGSGRWALAAAEVPQSTWRAAILRDPDEVFAPARDALSTGTIVIGTLAATSVGVSVATGRRMNAADRRRSEEAAQAERDRRHDIEQRDELLGLIAHELRTPLAVILARAEYFDRRYAAHVPVEVAETMTEIQASGRRVQRLLENMLVLSQAASDVPAELEPQLLPHVLATTVADFHERFPDHDVRVEADSTLPVVLANSTFVDQILWNLLTNAAKYAGADAPIVLAARRTDGLVETSVSDAGPGIADADIARVFDPHFRTRAARAHAVGLGLGLSVCRRLVEMQGGEITARRNEAGGMTFAFTLPALDDDPLPRSA